MTQGGRVIGVAFGEDFRRVHHVMAEKIQDIFRFSGSKYIQSDPTSVLRSVQGLSEKFIFVGTPCQVAGVRRLVECGVLRGDFTLIDFFCHGVPSYVLWDSYLNFLQKRVGRILHIEQRFKVTDWHRFQCRVFGSRGVYCRGFEEDPFGFLYLQNYLLRESCYTCPYRGYHSFADLRLGDFWGELFSHDRLGTSLVVAFTEKGFQILVENKDVFLQSMPVEAVGASKATSVSRPEDGELILAKFRQGMSMEKILQRRFCLKRGKLKFRKVLFLLLRTSCVRAGYRILRRVLRG
jgi:coenzyme F420-reducing hydrogenase beta subunit